MFETLFIFSWTYTPLFVILALTSLSFVWSAKASKQIKTLSGRAPQVPTYLPLGLDGTLSLLCAQAQRRVIQYWQDLMHKYDSAGGNTVELTVLGKRLILTSSLENIKAILATKFDDFGKGPLFRNQCREFLGDGIFALDGEQWHRIRQLIRPQFTKDRVSDLKTFENHVNNLMSKITESGGEVELLEFFSRYTLDIATDFLFGKSVASLDDSEDKFSSAFSHIQSVQSLIFRAGPLHAIIPRGSYRKAIKLLNNFIEPFIDDTLQIPLKDLEEKTKSDKFYTFLHALANHTRDRNLIRDQLVSLLLAGRDTTACTLTWLFYELARNPRIFNKLRNEILTTIGPLNPPTYDDLKNMRYLQNTISETLRLYPIVPFNIRYTMRPSSLPEGGVKPPRDLESKQRPIVVLPGTIVAYSTFLLHRNPALYPATSPTFAPVETFSPERWENWIPKPWQYIPFSGGPRICLGQNFALTVVGYTVTRILQRFSHIELAAGSDADEPVLIPDIVLHPGNPVLVRFSKVA